MRRMIIVLFLLSGCAAHRPVTLNVTGSPCFDGIIVNLDDAGCKEIIINQVPGKPITHVRCSEMNDSLWTQHYFYFAPPAFNYIDDTWNAVCSDPSTDTFFISRHNNIVE